MALQSSQAIHLARRLVWKGGDIRFGTLDDIVGLGEGIENVLSLMLLADLSGAIAALSAGNMKNVDLEESTKTVIIAADNDRNDTGRKAAEAAALAFTRK